MAVVAVVIVSYNVRALLAACLRSLADSEGVDLRVWVVDNASGDDSVAMVAAQFPWVRLIASPSNVGYAGGNNLALAAIAKGEPLNESSPSLQEGPDYVLLLNPDTVVPPRAIADLVAFMEAQPEVGICGPKLIRGDGSLDLACRRSFPTPEVAFYRLTGLSRLFPRSRRFGRYNMTYLDPDTMAEVDSVVGACMLVRWTAAPPVGFLDDAFFLYGEDLDWAFRIKQRGWKVVYYPAVTVLHYKGESSRQVSERATVEFYRAMLIFYRKHYARGGFDPLGWLIVAAIYGRGAIAYGRNRLRSRPLRRVG